MDQIGGRDELADMVRTILLRDWDPIRVQEFSQRLRLANADEYDPYVEPLVGMILDGREASAMARYLLDIETWRIGIKGGHSRAAEAADALFGLEARFGHVGQV